MFPGMFPGAMLGRYIEAAAFRAVLLVAAGLTALFSLLGFVEQLADVGQGRYGLIDAFAYVLLTVPSRLLQVAPVSMLLGCLLALGALARNSELAAMRSLGISEGRIVLSMVKLALPVILALFLLAEFVIPPVQQRAQTLRATALYSTALHNDQSDFWAQNGNQYLNVRRFGYGAAPGAIEILTFAADGRLKSFIRADRAEIRPDGTWLLQGVLRKRVVNSGFATDRLASLPWRSFISRRQLELLRLSPQDMPPLALYRYVRGLERRHLPALRFEQELWARLSVPLSIVAMVMIAASFAFGLPRTQSAGQNLMIGGVLGIVFTLIQQIAGRLDLLLGLDPMATALTPPLLLMALALYLVQRPLR